MNRITTAVMAIVLAACDPGSGSDTNTTDGTGTTSTSESSTSESSESSTSESADSTSGAGSSTGVDDSGSSSEGTGTDTDGPVVGGYGDCANDDFACLPTEACLFDGVRGVCAADCSSPADCPIPDLDPAVPPSATPAEVTCAPIVAMECVLGCNVSADCPEGMTCVNAGVPICMWPTFPEGGGQCPDEDLGSASPQTYNGTNVGFIDDHFPSCSFGGGEDVLLAWTAPADGAYTFDTDGSSFDTTLSILDECDGTEIACGNNQLPMGLSSVTQEMVAGESIIIVIDSDAGQSGPFTLNISG